MARRCNRKSDAELAELRSVRRRQPLAAIRARCVDCCAGVAAEVELCEVRECANWAYRFGIDPWAPSAELPPPAATEPAIAEPVPGGPKVESLQMPATARRTWRQHAAIHVDNAREKANIQQPATSDGLENHHRLALSAVQAPLQAAPKVGRGDDAAGMVRNTGMVSAGMADAPVAREVAAPANVKRKRGRPPKQQRLL